MMKLMCDCGCGHAITEYDAGQMPVILQHGGLVMELRVVPGPTGARPNVRPTCARAAATHGDIVFPRFPSVDDTVVHMENLGVRSISGRREQLLGDGEGDERMGLIAAPVSGTAANAR